MGAGRLRTPLRALIVEDSEEEASRVIRELKRGEYETVYERVESPENMREALEGSEWDVIFSSYRMYRFGATEALEVARRAGSEAPFIIVSDDIGEDAAVEAVKAGADDLVTKDNLSRLSAAVRRGLKEAEERRSAKERLEQSEEHFRNAFELAPIGMAMAEPDGRWLKVNQPLCEMLGYTEAELLSTTFQAVTHPDDVDLSSESMRGLSDGEVTSYQIEKRYVHKEGHVVWALVSVSPVRDAQGEFLYGIAHIQDITESKRAEEALRESEERFRSAFEAAPIGMALVRLADGRWLQVNRPLCDLLGYPEHELLGLTWQEVTYPDDLDADLRQVEQMLRGEIRAFQMEKRYIRKNGRVVWGLLSSSLVRDAGGEPLYGIAQVEDITARKQAEEALKQSERLWRNVIEQAQENICLIDAETRRVVEANPAFQQALGYTEEELQHLTLHEIVAADRRSIERNIREVSRKGRHFVGQRKYRRKDGTLLDVEVSASAISRGGRKTFCVLAHDVTGRVQAQELLERRLASLTRIAANLALQNSIEGTLDTLAQSAVKASTAVACSVVLATESPGAPDMVGSYGLPEGYARSLQDAYQTGIESPATEVFLARHPVLVRSVQRLVSSDPLYSSVHRFVREAEWDPVYIVPLISRERSLGAINFYYIPGQEPGEDEKVFLGAVADQAAIAVEKARLLSEARGKAALEERQRLARELHDSVSQALYGIALGAETARELLEENPKQAAEPLDYIRSLNETGIAEMRALIFELRPESLEEEGLCVALEKQAAAVQARHKLAIELTLCNEPDASPEIKEAIYRITQEALNNVAKHAHADHVRLELRCDLGSVIVDICDDGVGFNPDGNFRGHLGLRSMHERASRLGGTLEVDSVPESGTRVRARIPL